MRVEYLRNPCCYCTDGETEVLRSYDVCKQIQTRIHVSLPLGERGGRERKRETQRHRKTSLFIARPESPTKQLKKEGLFGPPVRRCGPSWLERHNIRTMKQLGHVASTVRKQKVTNARAQPASFCYSVRDLSPWHSCQSLKGWVCPPRFKPLWKYTHKHVQRGVSPR